MAEINLPDDIIYQILLKLPVKTLLRFHSLSTKWNKAIRSCDFAKEHWLLQFGSETASCTRHVLLMCNSAGFSYRCGFGLITDYKAGRVMNVKIDLPFKKYLDGKESWEYWSGISSSCHGLLCLIYQCNDNVILFIWNPLTNDYREAALPEEYVPRDHLEIKNNAFVGFGYDHVINEYKIVVYFKKLGDCCYVMTLSTNVWRKIDAPLWQHLYQFSSWSSIGLSPVFVRGDLFWIVRDRRNPYFRAILLKFNLVEERLSTGFVPVGEMGISNIPFYGKLTQYKGSLCYCIYVFDKYDGAFIGWTLEHYDVQTPDDSRYNFIVQWELLLAATRGDLWAEPVGFDRDGDIAIMSIDRGRGLAAYLPGENSKLVKLNLSEQVEDTVQDVHYLEMESLFCP